MYADVIVDISSSQIDKIFEYTCSEDIVAGMRVLVPFGNRTIEGYVLKIKSECSYDKTKIKNIIKKLDDFQAILPEMLELMEFMRKKYHLRRVDILRIMLPPQLRSGSQMLFEYDVSINHAITIDEVYNNLISSSAKKQREVYDFLKDKEKMKKKELTKLFSPNIINTLIYKGVLLQTKTQKKRRPQINEVEQKKIILSEEQSNAVEQIRNFGNDITLIHGVTGSGKTEIYFNLIEEKLKEQRTAILLVPEISLTNQVVSLLTARFLDKVAILHSALSGGERLDEWMRLISGEAKIAVGARSAIFAPIKDIGIIIIDEEHDSSYISDSNPRYFTYDIASFRSKYNNAPLVLGSATPSIETYYKAKTNQIKLVELKNRVNKKKLPKFEIIDMKKELLQGNNEIFSMFLLKKIEECIKKKEQAILFINRRGFSSYQLCPSCGYVAKCEDCSASLVLHREDNLLKCHFCARRYKPLDVCPECGNERIKQGLAGTEYVSEKIQNYFKDCQVFRMDSDTTTGKNAHAKLLTKFANTKPAILVGTQMIAKGHDFDSVSIVGIIDSDMNLYNSDFRSTERTFELITQVAGRAGRKNTNGLVVLQTYAPRHYVYKFATTQDYISYYEKEINLREVTSFPPFAIIVRILISSENEEIANNALKEIYTKILQMDSSYFVYRGAMNSPVRRIMKKFRKQILLRIKNPNLINDLYDIIDSVDSLASIFVEINPKSLY